MNNRQDYPTETETTRSCCTCGAEFDWPPGEQAWYAARGYPPPRRCRDCRPEKRARFGKGDES